MIEDAACALARRIVADRLGRAEITAWSFHPRKIITTGEGGMITTSRKIGRDRARWLREHAMSVSAADRHGQVIAPQVTWRLATTTE